MRATQSQWPNHFTSGEGHSPLRRPLPSREGHTHTLPPRRLRRPRSSRLRRSVPPAFPVSPPDLRVLAETLGHFTRGLPWGMGILSRFHVLWVWDGMNMCTVIKSHGLMEFLGVFLNNCKIRWKRFKHRVNVRISPNSPILYLFLTVISFLHY